ncbi:hypothetical protein B0F90DRAFT_1367591 [Multifurca ochricompacta]|uniref:MARVEL domain-containing protein n=1 Tax=Multifurca ochricompacta TaxID=376703 RepID=A0AAD4QPP0_9AGAM|nr:hypothetical protein B0F90DRAFT_1367591 [Multifurca ochricompacta]
MPLLTFTFPPWLPGFLCYLFLLVINIILSLITLITLQNVATALEIVLVTCNSFAGVIVIAVLFFKLLMRSCMFNDIKLDRKALLGVTILDAFAAVAWSIHVDKKGFCAKSLDGQGKCHTPLLIFALILAWISVLVAYGAAVYSDHGKKRKETSTLPIHLSGRVISPPVVIHAGHFSGYEVEDERKFRGFTEIPF